MKSVFFGSLSCVLLAAMLACCGRGDSAAARGEALEAVVREFLTSGVKQDIEKIRDLTVEDFQFYLPVESNEVRSIARENFLKLVEMGKPNENLRIRDFEVLSLVENEAAVKVVSSSDQPEGSQTLTSRMVLEKIGDDWKLREVKVLESSLAPRSAAGET